MIDDLNKYSISCEITFQKEMEIFRNFSKSVDKRFEKINNILADISSKTCCSRFQLGDSQVVVELLKTGYQLQKSSWLKKRNYRFSFHGKKIKTFNLQTQKQGKTTRNAIIPTAKLNCKKEATQVLGMKIQTIHQNQEAKRKLLSLETPYWMAYQKWTQ